MIYRIRTLDLLPAQASAVRAVSRRAAAYVNAQYPGIQVEILENVAGPRDQIHMVTACSSLAALEAYEAQREADPQWVALVHAVEALHGIVGTVDTLYRMLPPVSLDADALPAPFDLHHIPPATAFIENIEP